MKYDGRRAARERTRFIGEKHAHAARRFDARRTLYKHVVLRHFRAIRRKHYGDHHGQAFRHGDDDYGDGERERVHEIGKHGERALEIRFDERGIHGVIEKKRVEKIGERNENGGEIPEARKRACKHGKLALQRTIAFILFERACHLPVKGVFAHFAYARDRFAARDKAAFERLFSAGKSFRARERLGRFFHFRAFARERGLRESEFARKQRAVRRDELARFQ